MQTETTSTEHTGGRRPTEATRLTIWLLILFVATHYGYEFAPHPYAAFTSGLGALVAILAWEIRGPKAKARWFVCLLGAIEGWQIFVCQGMQNWVDFNLPRFHGACEYFFGLPTYAWGMGLWAVVAGFVAAEATNGNRSQNS